MKKIISVTSLFVILIIHLFAPSVSAADVNEITDAKFYKDSILSAVDDETLDILEEIGLNTFSSEEMFSVSFEKIGDYFSETISEKIKNASVNIVLLLCIIVIIIAVKAYFIAENSAYMSFLSISAVVISSVGLIENVINMLINTLNAGSVFIHSFVPVYTMLLSLSGNVSSAVTYNSLTFTFAQTITFITDSAVKKLLGAYFSISIAFSVNSIAKLNRFVSAVSKTVNTVVGFISSTFAALLTVRGAFSASLDTVSSKSIRFIIGNLIPVVGSSISDAYSTLIGSINIIKGSVAAIGILVMVVIIVPPVLESTVYCLFFSFLSYISEMAELNEISSFLKSVSLGIRILIMLNFLIMFVLIISTAIMLSAKGGV